LTSEEIDKLEADFEMNELQAYCADCGIPQPGPYEIHLEQCPQHKEGNCLVCMKGDPNGTQRKEALQDRQGRA